MLSKEKQMDVLEAYDLTKSLRAAAELTGVDHHTVARYVAARATGTALEELALSGRPRATASRTRSPSGSSAPRARSAPTSSTNGSSPWATPAQSAPPGGWWPRSRPPIATPTTASTSPGSPNLACGSNTTSVTDPVVDGVHRVVLRLAGLEPLPGDHPARPIAPWPRSSPRSTGPFASSAARRPTC